MLSPMLCFSKKHTFNYHYHQIVLVTKGGIIFYGDWGRLSVIDGHPPSAGMQKILASLFEPIENFGPP